MTATSDELDVILEVWERLVEYIPDKDKDAAAVSFVSYLDNIHLDGQDWEKVKEADVRLSDAYTELFGEDEEEDAFSDDEDNDGY
tara:strand:- start:27071 stop:27325 length:255 start_codon:yes stop_codon:yes gene_type:complete